MSEVDIIIGTYNHCDDLLKLCVESIYNFTDMSRVNLMIVANGCTDNTREYLKDKQHLWFDEPLGYSKAFNAGIKATNSEFVLLFSNDCIWLPQPKNYWLDTLLKPFEDPTVGVVGNHWNTYNFYNFLLFACIMIRRKTLEDLNYIDEIYGVGSAEDADFCYRAEKKGWKLKAVCQENIRFENNYMISSFPLYHKAEGTVHDKSLVKDWNNIFQNNFKIFKERMDSKT